jgi:radical SAM protein with 4Fe4S-binding SPASM domain
MAVSYYCNQHCQHCYVPELNRDGYKHLLEEQQLTLPQIDDFINYLIHEFKLDWVTVSGGEPLLSNVWPRTRHVMQYALHKGLTVQVNTSGSGQINISEVTEAAKQELDGLIIQVSLDGINDHQVDAFRGQRGAMKRALETIRQAVESGVFVRVRYTMTEQNYGDTVACYELVSAMGARSFVTKPMFAAGSARDNRDLLLSTDIVEDVQRRLAIKSMNSGTQLDLAQPVYISHRDCPTGSNVNIIHCVCGRNAAYLSANGDVYPCMYLVGAPRTENLILGNIKNSDFNFRQMWAKQDTCSAFRNAKAHGNCTAQNILRASL